MAESIKVLGVHPIAADEPCHLVEVLVENIDNEFDFGEITQEVEGQPRDNWQVPYEEQVLEEGDGKARYAFFFHYLDLDKPLLGPSGSLPLPKPTKVPKHLKSIEYEAP